MPNMSTIDPSFLYCMFKGEPGTRKSTAALSFPTPQYWLSFDQKMKGINIPMRNWGVDPSLIDYDDYKDWEAAKKKLEKFQVDCTNPQTHVKYKTIVVDSITSCADTTLRQIQKFKGGSDKGKVIGGIPVSSIEDFNAESAVLSELVALTKDIHIYHKVNVILIAHVVQTEQKSVDGRTHMSRIIVTAAKKIAVKIPAYCDEVYHFNMKGDKYSILTRHSGDDFARTTLPLNNEITFNDKQLYQEWIKPAIKKMQEPVKVVTHI